MTASELKQLRALAQAATPGPWRVEAQGHASQEVARVNNLEVAPPDSVELSHCATDAAYIAALSPDVVLALLSEVERLRAQLAAAEAFHKVAERNYEPQLAAAEAFRLRADAERYRWLRDHGVKYAICQYESSGPGEDNWCGWSQMLCWV